MLLGASYFYYMSWKPKYIVVLLGITILTYLVALLLEKDLRMSTRRMVLGTGILASLGILIFFKYSTFIGQVVLALISRLDLTQSIPTPRFLVPIGISFFTIQAMGYLLDVYRGTIRAEKHLGIFAVYMSFFPQVVSGPIARANHLLPQLHEFNNPDYEEIVIGLLRMAWGFFKKLVVADRLALIVNTVYGDPISFSGIPLIIATYAFAIQIYCDFSGYADIAIGASRVLGIRLSENFNMPYLARSIPDFWRRWHISLSNWLRDYIFYPLNRSMVRSSAGSKSWLTLAFPPLITMTLSGLWHGANWTYVVWGILHGVLMVLTIMINNGKVFTDWTSRLPAWLSNSMQIFLTFHIVTLTWVFFRAESLSDAFYILSHLFSNLNGQPGVFNLIGGRYEFFIAILGILVMAWIHWMQGEGNDLRTVLLRQPGWLRWLAYYGLVISILMFGKLGAIEFIYLRF